MSKFEKPYSGCRGLKIGYMDSDTKKDVIVEMTNEHERYAKEYLKKTGEYICQFTMQKVFQQFARGTLTFDEVRTIESKFSFEQTDSASEELSETLIEQLGTLKGKQEELVRLISERETLENSQNIGETTRKNGKGLSCVSNSI